MTVEYEQLTYEDLSREFQELYPAAARAFELIPLMYNRLTLVDKQTHKDAIKKILTDHQELSGFSIRNIRRYLPSDNPTIPRRIRSSRPKNIDNHISSYEKLSDNEQSQVPPPCKGHPEPLVGEMKCTAKFSQTKLDSSYEPDRERIEGGKPQMKQQVASSQETKKITEPKVEPANDNLVKDLSTCRNCELLETENLQLREALESKIQLITAEKLLENGERKFIILKRHESKIINALQNCNNNCNLVFTSDGILARIEPDTLQESDDVEKET